MAVIIDAGGHLLGTLNVLPTIHTYQHSFMILPYRNIKQCNRTSHSPFVQMYPIDIDFYQLCRTRFCTMFTTVV